MPTIATQAGFLDHFILASDAEPDRVVILTLWNRAEDAEWFHQRHYNRMRQWLDPLLEFEPVIRTFKVEERHAPGSGSGRPPRDTAGPGA